MQSRPFRRNLTILAGAGLAAFALATYMQSRPLQASPPPPPAHLTPMRLAAATLPTFLLGIAPGPAISANVDITLTSSGGPFCLQGLTINPSASTADPVGEVWINVNSIDGNGVSHPYLTLVDGTTQGYAPQDVILSYGNAICASQSITFQARQFAAPSGPGQVISLNGTAVYLSASNVIVTAG
jgi:hypothetical protein